MVPAGGFTEHECPRYCHFCPLMDGDVMPSGCTGQAARGNPLDMWACTCPENAHIFDYVNLNEVT